MNASINQKRLTRLRFTGYFSNQFTSILAPLIVFKLTQSVAYAALALIIEWAPKVLVYLAGGSVVERLGFKISHTLSEIFRLLSLSGLAFACWGLSSLYGVILVGVCAGLAQCTNAVSNIIYERSVSTHWESDKRAVGQTLLLKQDQLGCFIALSLGLLFPDVKLLVLIALGIQLIATCLIFQWGSSLHESTPILKRGNSSLFSQIKQDMQELLKNKELLKVALITLMVFTPIAVGVSGLAFFIAKASSTFNQEQYRVFGLFFKTIVALVLLSGVQRVLKKSTVKLEHLAVLGLSLISAGVFILGIAKNAEIIVLSLGIYVGCLGLLNPWLRSTRQALINNHVTAASRAGVTGLMSATEPLGFIIGALLLALTGAHLTLTVLLAATLPLLAIILLRYVKE